MKRGDLVQTSDGIGVIVSYHKEYDNKPNGYPWYVNIKGRLHHLQTHQIKKVDSSKVKDVEDVKRGSVVRFKKTGYVVIYLGKSEGMYCFYSGEYGKCDFAADRFKWSKLEIISEAR